MCSHLLGNIFKRNSCADSHLIRQLDDMEMENEFELEELPVGVVFSEDEEDRVDPGEKDDW